MALKKIGKDYHGDAIFLQKIPKKNLLKKKWLNSTVNFFR